MKKQLTRLWRSTLLSVLCSAATQAQAITITPTESRYEAGGVRYYFVVTDWSYTDYSKSRCQNDDPIFTVCYIYIGANASSTSINWAGNVYSWTVPVRRGNSTMGDLLRDLNREGFQIPFKGSILVPKEAAGNNRCIGLSSSMVGPNIGGGINPFGLCAPVIKPALQCEISGDTTIDHKSLADDAVNGKKASTQLNVKCTGATSVTVSASRTDSFGVKLNNDGSLYSNVTVNGREATYGTWVGLTEGNTQIDITSTLSTRGKVTPGPFSGSTVITVSPP